ncbi:response regulator transcription factor [Pararhodospirillum photometricum]|uniref:Two component transcriptional regulator, winged helix family n=1 Tax=Pararhodospirillum photometricum DSM 122 TaxID=1150469 RepID=H6SL43_PARPM|nr:response regulator transcription factor [Pararhodospirillum photometricum]CCG08708.1 Two component transcriptional regulator, winged helix family [Pararhodospirillum photometricum DSM 122]
MRVLVVEDEPTLAASLARVLERAGFVVDVAPDGEEGHFLGDTEPYDAVVLDLGLPRLDGVGVLRRWRADGRSMPVLILTARGGWAEKVAGFEAGADDFLAKPFEMEEVIYRLKALIRRASGHGATTLTVGPLRYDTLSGKAWVDGVPLDLTAQEGRILSYLLHHAGRPVSRTEIIEHVYDRDFDSDSNVIDVLIGRLRRKLGAPLIHTVRGLGYCLEAR